MQETTDALLVIRALADDKQAFNLLIERYQAMALFLALRYTGDREAARDLVQEALLQAYLSLHRLREPARFKSWFYGIVLNLCRSWIRERMSTPAIQDFSYVYNKALEADPQEVVEEHELHQILREAVDILSPNNRAVALLFYYEDFSIQSIASLLGISQTAVRNRLLKGREQLRTHLKTLYPDMLITTPRQYRRTVMIPMILARVQQKTRTTVVLVDELQQKALLLSFMTERDLFSEMRMFSSTQERVASTEPPTAEFIMNILQALHGVLEVIEIDTLQADILYTRVKLHGPDSVQQNIKARLETTLPLVIALQCPILVAQDVLERQGIKLADFGQTLEQQLDAIVRLAQQSSLLGHSQALSIAKAPRNLDFTEGFRGWSFIGFPENYYEYLLDTAVTYKNKNSLAIILREKKIPAEKTAFDGWVILTHEGFVADSFQGKRLRMIAYTRAENMKRGVFNLLVRGPASDTEGIGPMYMATSEHEPIEGTSDWRRYELVIDVPEDAVSIQCSFSMAGSGNVWLDSFQFEVVDASVALTGTRVMPPPRQPVNLSFEHNFDGWIIAGSCPQDYRRAIEAGEQGTNKNIVYFKNSVEQPRGNIALQQIINSYDYCGKMVRLSAIIRVEDVIQQASLYLAPHVTKW